MQESGKSSVQPGPIGVFDSGYGGLTVLREFVAHMPQYDFIYLGDNARAPYGSRSFETVHEYTWQAVKALFAMNCSLVILACNTASAKALRTIQQRNLPSYDSGKRVLGVIRPTTEIVGNYTKTGHIGILGTTGTVTSLSYPIEISKFFPSLHVFQQECPMWVPLVESDETGNPGSGYFVKKCLDQLMSQSDRIDTLVLACTHYPLLMNQIQSFLRPGIKILSQGEVVALSLENYLERHPEMEKCCSKRATRTFYTSDDPTSFDRMAGKFFGQTVKSNHLEIR